MAEVSVIVPTLNSPLIDSTIAALCAQSRIEAVREILVIGRDESGLIPSHPLVKFVDTQMPVTAPIARNIGVRLAQGELLAFVDADCIAEPDWLASLLDATGAGSDVVSGAMAFAGDNYWATAYNISMFHEFLPSARGGDRVHLPTANLLVRRRVIEAVGLLDETLPRGQDTDWTARMTEQGYQLRFVPQARVLHDHARRTARAVWREWVRSGAFSVQIRQRHPRVLAAPAVLRSGVLLIVLSPLVALLNTVRIFVRDRALWHYAYVSPAVYLTKLAWCWGAARPRPTSVGIHRE
jgi:glycosyltransferase involved in cell wall biosynthesis